MLDVNLGLRQLNGNQSLYHKLLTLFLEQLRNDFASLPSQLKQIAEGNEQLRKATQQLNHALKGVAGNLALNTLANLSAEIDLILKRDEPINTAQAHFFAQTLSETEKAIQDYLTSNTQHSESMNAASEYRDIRPQLLDLARRIQGNEFIDDDELSALTIHIPAQQQPQWQKVIEALAEFDFDQAHTELQALLT
ncbi:MAG: Hpt domain-containing protein [Moraxella osloensis]|nr:Hpt domain-containing protein [Moraxella osloensis]MBD3767667.1 Hpt domain-containing protein [Gammaproteobacteria bacterium]